MRFLVVLAALCASALAAPSYGYGSAFEVRKPMDSYGGSSFEVRKPMDTYGSSFEVRKPMDSYGYSAETRRFVPILKFDYENKDGTHRLHTVSADNTVVQSVGSLRNIQGAKEGPVSVSSGSYSFVGDDGKTYSTRWTSDENGFQAFGDHLPTAPPVPEMPHDLRAAFDQAKADFERLAKQEPVAPIHDMRREAPATDVRVRFGDHYSF